MKEKKISAVAKEQHTATGQSSINADGHTCPPYVHQAMQDIDKVDPVLQARFRGDAATQTENRVGEARKCCFHDVTLAGVRGGIDLELRAVVQPFHEQAAAVQEPTTQNVERHRRKASGAITEETKRSTKAQEVAVSPLREISLLHVRFRGVDESVEKPGVLVPDFGVCVIETAGKTSRRVAVVDESVTALDRKSSPVLRNQGVGTDEPVKVRVQDATTLKGVNSRRGVCSVVPDSDWQAGSRIKGHEPRNAKRNPYTKEDAVDATRAATSDVALANRQPAVHAQPQAAGADDIEHVPAVTPSLETLPTKPRKKGRPRSGAAQAGRDLVTSRFTHIRRVCEGRGGFDEKSRLADRKAEGGIASPRIVTPQHHRRLRSERQ